MGSVAVEGRGDVGIRLVEVGRHPDLATQRAQRPRLYRAERHQACHGAATTRDRDHLAGLGPFDEAAEVRLCFVDVDGGWFDHGRPSLAHFEAEGPAWRHPMTPGGNGGTEWHRVAEPSASGPFRRYDDCLVHAGHDELPPGRPGARRLGARRVGARLPLGRPPGLPPRGRCSWDDRNACIGPLRQGVRAPGVQVVCQWPARGSPATILPARRTPGLLRQELRAWDAHQGGAGGRAERSGRAGRSGQGRQGGAGGGSTSSGPNLAGIPEFTHASVVFRWNTVDLGMA